VELSENPSRLLESGNLCNALKLEARKLLERGLGRRVGVLRIETFENKNE
jgi:hypothetical protein